MGGLEEPGDAGRCETAGRAVCDWTRLACLAGHPFTVCRVVVVGNGHVELGLVN